MSEELDTSSPDVAATPAGDSSVPSTTDVSGDSSTPVADAPQSGVFDDVDFSDTFGLPPEVKETPEATPEPPKTPDVKEAPGSPDARPIEDATTEADVKKEVPKVETESTDKDAKAKDDQSFKLNDKIDWETGPKMMREEFKNLKKAYLEVLESSVESQYLNDPFKFADWMKETSPTSFAEVGGILATESAKAHPKEWLQFFAENNPDLVAEIATGREGITAERLKAELSLLLDDDDPDLIEAIESQKQAKGKDAEKPAETPEQKELREWREERAQEQAARFTSEVFQPIEQSVDRLVSQAGLEIDLSEYQGKNFSELDEDARYKVMVNEMLPEWIAFRVKQDPRLVAMEERLKGFIANKDIKSAKALQHPITIATTNFANEFLSIVTGQKAKAKQTEITPPAKDQPKPIVKTAGASANGMNGHAKTGSPTLDEWTTITEADL